MSSRRQFISGLGEASPHAMNVGLTGVPRFESGVSF